MLFAFAGALGIAASLLGLFLSKNIYGVLLGSLFVFLFFTFILSPILIILSVIFLFDKKVRLFGLGGLLLAVPSLFGYYYDNILIITYAALPLYFGLAPFYIKELKAFKLKPKYPLIVQFLVITSSVYVLLLLGIAMAGIVL